MKNSTEEAREARVMLPILSRQYYCIQSPWFVERLGTVRQSRYLSPYKAGYGSHGSGTRFSEGPLHTCVLTQYVQISAGPVEMTEYACTPITAILALTFIVAL